MITIFISFILYCVLGAFDIYFFNKAIDTPKMTDEEWETNSFRMFPGGGIAAAWKYRNGVKNKY